MKRFLKGIFVLSIVICAVVLIKIIFKISTNKFFINNYQKKDQEYRLKVNTFLNIYEPYVVYYNYGNYLYQKEEYDKAYEKYLQALKYNMSSDNFCRLNMNIAATLYKVSEGMNKTNKVKLLKEADSHLQKCLNTNLQSSFKLSTALLIIIFIMGFALIILAIIMKSRMGIISNTDAHYLKELDRLKNNLMINDITTDDALIKVKNIISEFVKINTKIDILSLSKSEINKLGIKSLNTLTEVYYDAFSKTVNNFDMIEHIEKMMEVIRKWNWN